GSGVTGTAFNWTVVQVGVTGAADGNGNSIAQILTTTGNSVGTATYTITPSANSCDGNSITVVITVNPIPDVVKPADQPLCDGETTTAVTFTGAVAGTVFNWINDNPSIGLGASGTGNIAAFPAINSTNAPIVATVTVTPEFTNGGSTCNGTAQTFTY